MRQRYNYRTLKMIQIVLDLKIIELANILECSEQHVGDIIRGDKTFAEVRQKKLEKTSISFETCQYLLGYECLLRENTQYTDREKYYMMLEETIINCYPSLAYRIKFFNQNMDMIEPLLKKCLEEYSSSHTVKKRKVHAIVMRVIRKGLDLDTIGMANIFKIGPQYVRDNESGKRKINDLKLNLGLKELHLSREVYDKLVAYTYFLTTYTNYSAFDSYLFLLMRFINIVYPVELEKDHEFTKVMKNIKHL